MNASNEYTHEHTLYWQKATKVTKKIRIRLVTVRQFHMRNSKHDQFEIIQGKLRIKEKLYQLVANL